MAVSAPPLRTVAMRLPLGNVDPFQDRTRMTTYCFTAVFETRDQETRAFLPLAAAETLSRVIAVSAGDEVVDAGVEVDGVGAAVDAGREEVGGASAGPESAPTEPDAPLDCGVFSGGSEVAISRPFLPTM